MLNAAVAIVFSAASFAVADEKIDPATAIQKIQQLGGRFNDDRPMGASLALEPIPTVVIPYWMIVIPLTLLAAYLLLSQPKPRLVPVRSKSH